MNAQELRIGNWVLLKRDFYATKAGQPYKIRNVGVDYLDHWQDMGASDSLKASQVEPIPLTEEILLKAGFKNDSYANFSIKVADYAHLVYSFKEYTCITLSEFVTVADHDLNVKCEYVHQIQNLYFALTGTEIDIEL